MISKLSIHKNNKMVKKMSVLVVMLVLCVMASNVEESSAQGVDCYDSCSTACVAYVNNPRLMSRCDRKCQIRCGPDSQVEKNLD